MGTNYYIYMSIDDDVTKDPEELHIGKSSHGWVFLLRVYPERGINTLYDWMKILLNYEHVIRDEYGTQINTTQMLRTIMLRSAHTAPNFSDADWKLNSAEQGPNNLVRYNVSALQTDAGLSVWHGEGTWDYCNYEFF